MVVACGVDTPHELKVKNDKLKNVSGVKRRIPLLTSSKGKTMHIKKFIMQKNCEFQKSIRKNK
jgi:hypothetical protein